MHHYLGCTSIYRPLSYPLRSQVLNPQDTFRNKSESKGGGRGVFNHLKHWKPSLYPPQFFKIYIKLPPSNLKNLSFYAMILIKSLGVLGREEGIVCAVVIICGYYYLSVWCLRRIYCTPSLDVCDGYNIFHQCTNALWHQLFMEIQTDRQTNGY